MLTTFYIYSVLVCTNKYLLITFGKKYVDLLVKSRVLKHQKCILFL